jgi:hypothetical protein
MMARCRGNLAGTAERIVPGVVFGASIDTKRCSLNADWATDGAIRKPRGTTTGSDVEPNIDFCFTPTQASRPHQVKNLAGSEGRSLHTSLVLIKQRQEYIDV